MSNSNPRASGLLGAMLSVASMRMMNALPGDYIPRNLQKRPSSLDRDERVRRDAKRKAQKAARRRGR